jgi:hypothetical protein
MTLYINDGRISAETKSNGEHKSPFVTDIQVSTLVIDPLLRKRLPTAMPATNSKRLLDDPSLSKLLPPLPSLVQSLLGLLLPQHSPASLPSLHPKRQPRPVLPSSRASPIVPHSHRMVPRELPLLPLPQTLAVSTRFPLNPSHNPLDSHEDQALRLLLLLPQLASRTPSLLLHPPLLLRLPRVLKS